MKRKHWLLLAALCVLQAEASAAEIYKCKSADGKISYRGQPSVEKGTQCETILQKKTGGVLITSPAQGVPPGMCANFWVGGGRARREGR